MRVCISVLILIFISVFSVRAQTVHYPDAISTALSGSDIAYSGYWFKARNPATLASYKVTALGFNYHNCYLIPCLSSESLVGTLTSKGTWGFAFDYFGTHMLNESCFSLSYGRKIFQWFDLGITMNGYRLLVESLSEKSYTVSGDIGFIIHLQEEVKLCVYLINPNRSEYFTSGGEALPSEINIGIISDPGKNFYLAAQFHWINYSEIFFSMGSEYRIGKSVALMGGIKVGSLTGYSYGLSCNYRKLTITLGFEQHTYLGRSAAMTLVYKITCYANQ